MKLLRRILVEPNNLWVQLVKKKYLKNNNSFFYYSPSQSGSWQWNNLMKLRPIFKKGLQLQIGNRRSILFWKDSWIFPYSLLGVIPTCANPDQKVEELFLPNRDWNIQALKEYLPDHIVLTISSLPIPSNNIQDTTY